MALTCHRYTCPRRGDGGTGVGAGEGVAPPRRRPAPAPTAGGPTKRPPRAGSARGALSASPARDTVAAAVVGYCRPPPGRRPSTDRPNGQSPPPRGRADAAGTPRRLRMRGGAVELRRPTRRLPVGRHRRRRPLRVVGGRSRRGRGGRAGVPRWVATHGGGGAERRGDGSSTAGWRLSMERSQRDKVLC